MIVSVEDEKLHFSQHFSPRQNTCGVIVHATTVHNYGDAARRVSIGTTHRPNTRPPRHMWPNTASHHLIDNKSVCGSTNVS